METNGCVVGKVGILLDLPRKRDGSILFAMLDAEVTDPDGRSLPHYALLRGHACLIVTVVTNRSTGAGKFLMIRQRRIGHGMDSLEFPAGMLDDEVGDPVGVAVKELREEVGLTVAPENLIRLSDRPLYTSPGLDDEAIHYFACRVELDDAAFRALEGGRGGLEEEGEHIKLGLWDYEDAVKIADSVQVHLAFHLYFDKLKGGVRAP